MRNTIYPEAQDTIGVFDDWGYADAISIKGRSSHTIIYVTGPARIAEMRAALDRIEADAAKREAEYARTREDRYMDEDAVYDRMRADEDAEELSEAGIE